MLTGGDKREVMEKLLTDLYTDYLKLRCVNLFVDNKYSDVMKEDEDQLRKDLKAKKDEISDFDESMRDKVMEDDQKEERKKLLAESKEIENKINVIVQAKVEIERQKQRLEETIYHYHQIKDWLEAEEFDNEPEL